jgi:hypothetical protein
MRILERTPGNRQVVIESEDDLGLVMFAVACSRRLAQSDSAVRRAISPRQRRLHRQQLDLRCELERIRMVGRLLPDAQPTVRCLSSASSTLAVLAIQECLVAQIERDASNPCVGWMPPDEESRFMARCLGAMDAVDTQECLFPFDSAELAPPKSNPDLSP